jgi:hypothetical protein
VFAGKPGDVLDRIVLFPPFHEHAAQVFGVRFARGGTRLAREEFLKKMGGGIAAQVPGGSSAQAEMTLDVLIGAALDETSAQDLVLPLGRALRLEKMTGLKGSQGRASSRLIRFCRN